MNLRLQRLLKLHGLMNAATGDEGGQTSGGGAGGSGGTKTDTGENGENGEGGGDGGGNNTTTDTDGDGTKTGTDPDKDKPTDREAKLLKESMDRKAKIKELEAQLKRFEGLDPDEVRRLLKAEAERKQAELEARGEFDAVKKQMADAHAAELNEREQKIAAKDAELAAAKARIAEMTVGASFASSAFINEELTLTPRKARTIYGAHFDYSEELDRVVAYDKPAGQKDRAPLVDGNGDPLPFDAALRKLVEADPDRDHMLKSKATPGAASTTTPVKPTEQVTELKGVSRISASLKQQAQ